MNVFSHIKLCHINALLLAEFSDKNNGYIRQLEKKHPNIKVELNQLEKGLEIYSNQYRLTPPLGLKIQVMGQIEEEKRKPV